jgi:CHAD domain-containing protein
MARTCTLSEHEGLRCLRRQTEAHAKCTSPDADAADAVHNLRISCRRGRVILAEFKDNFPPAARRGARRLLRDAGRGLGRVREVDVSLSLLKRWAAGDEVRTAALAEMRRRLESERHAADPQVREMVRQLSGAEFAQTFTRLEEGFRPSTACHLRRVPKRLGKRIKRLRRQYRAWRTSRAEEDLHLLRIRFKMLRYTLEVHRGLYGNRAKEFLRALVSVQDTLGQWNDYRLLRNRVRDAATEASPQASKGIAALAAAIESDTAACAAAMDERLGPFFAKDEFRAYEAMLAAPKRACCRGAR